MKTRKDFIEFLNRVVGEEYYTTDDDSIRIRPYTYVVQDDNEAFVYFKGERIDRMYSHTAVLDGLIEIMNQSYTKGLLDCVYDNPNILGENQMSTFKFT